MLKKLKNFKHASITLVLVSSLITAVATGSWGTSSDLSQVHYKTLWGDMRANFALEKQRHHANVTKQTRWISQHRGYFYGIAKKASPYLYFIYQEVNKRHMPAEIALVPMIESSYDPFAYNKSGAAGLWQLMPRTATGLGLKRNWWYDGRRDVYHSTKAALDYLNYLHDRFDGDWLLALAAYDAGEGNVRKAMRRNKRKGLPTNFWALKLPGETKAYVPRILALSEIISHPDKYPAKLPEIENQPFFATVSVEKQIDLSRAAKLANMNLRDLYKLNPGFNRWATAPNGPHRLVLPIENIDTFKANLVSMPHSINLKWQKHVVKKGESLGRIASKFGTSSTELKNINHLKSRRLRSGQVLMIPNNGHTVAKASPNKKPQTKKKKSATTKKLVYKVRSNDSLWKIAHKYSVKITALRTWNHLKPKHTLHAGDSLVIYPATAV